MNIRGSGKMAQDAGASDIVNYLMQNVNQGKFWDGDMSPSGIRAFLADVQEEARRQMHDMPNRPGLRSNMDSALREFMSRVKRQADERVRLWKEDTKE